MSEGEFFRHVMRAVLYNPNYEIKLQPPKPREESKAIERALKLVQEIADAKRKIG
jgi:hypothetical protein